MYTIKVDGAVLFSSDAEDENQLVLKPRLSLDVNGTGSLSFTVTEGNAQYNNLKKLKSIVTVEQDEEVIFRGRVLDDERDIYNQRQVYCEGDKAFLMDSLQAPYSYNGSVQGFFRQLIANHNAKVESAKKFTVGTITAVGTSETVELKNEYYTDTATEFESKLLNAYGGYLRTRTVGSKHYIDWVKQYGGTSAQRIEFAVNLLDLKERVTAEDVFTILYPLGAEQTNEAGERTAPLTIESVNGGSAFIQDNAAVALYGKIERSYTWDYVQSASELLVKGREYLKTGVALQTLTLKAVDMHFVDGSVERIKLGDKVRILSNPNAVDLTMACTKMTVDLLNPESTSYTFGEAPRTLTENVAETESTVTSISGGGSRGGGRGGVKDEMKAILRWAEIAVDTEKARIDAVAWNVSELTDRTTKAELHIDGIEGTIELLAGMEYSDITENGETFYSQKDVKLKLDAANTAIELRAKETKELSGRVNSAESTLTVQAGQISSKVSKDGVISAINQTAESVTIQASKINLSGYVTASQLNAAVSDVVVDMSSTVSTNTLRATSAIITYLTLNGKYCTLKSATIDGTTINYVGY